MDVRDTHLTLLEIRRLAVEIECDPRSITRELHGQRVKGLVGERIRRALHDRGLPCSDSEAA